MTTTTTRANKITIQRIPPQFEARKLEELVAAAKHRYSNSPQNCIIVKSSTDKQFFQAISDHLSQGYELSPFPINYAPLNYNTHLIKSPELQTIDLAKIEVDIKAQYIESLEAEHVCYKELLLAQLLQSEQAKVDRKAEEAKEKLIHELQKQVDATYTPLTIPE